MTLRGFIIALVTCPLAALILIGGMHAVGNYQSFSTARTAQSETDHANHLFLLVHELQVERGQSAGFLSSKGQNFRTELRETRKHVNDEIKLQTQIASEIFARQTSLKTLRSQIDGQTITVPQMAEIYTSLINDFLIEAAEQITHQGNPELVKLATALIALNTAKEAAGIQRAAGAAGFGPGGFTLPTYNRFLGKGIVEQQFLNRASTLFDAFLPGHGLTDEKYTHDIDAVLDGVAHAGLNGEMPNITAQAWFTLSTKWIEHLHDVELEASKLLSGLAASDASSAGRSLVITLILCFASITACAVLGLRLIRLFDTQLSSVQDELKKLSEKEFDFTPEFIESKTEIGALSRAMDKTRISLRNAETLLEEAERDRSMVIQGLETHLERLANRDLDCPIDDAFPEDFEPLRHSFNQTVTTLGTSLNTVVDASGQIRKGASDISESADDLSRRTESQAATLEQTAAALEELSSSVTAAAESAKSVETIVGEARTDAESSGVVVKNAISAMTEIEKSSARIASIISVIDDITFQTNLLALNAGVEAARAGEAGRGFAVVASEVRALAQRSSEAATEINSLISESSTQVKEGVGLVNETGDALNTIIERVNHISTLVGDIAEGTRSQSIGLKEINMGVTQLDQVTQSNAAMVEQTSGATRILNSDASTLSDLVESFKLPGGAAHSFQPSSQDYFATDYDGFAQVANQ